MTRFKLLSGRAKPFGRFDDQQGQANQYLLIDPPG